jgi:hypothetical protein
MVKDDWWYGVSFHGVSVMMPKPELGEEGWAEAVARSARAQAVFMLFVVCCGEGQISRGWANRKLRSRRVFCKGVHQ